MGDNMRASIVFIFIHVQISVEDVLDDQDHLGSAPGPPYALPEFSGFGLKIGGRRADSIASYALPNGTSLSHRSSFASDHHWADLKGFGVGYEEPTEFGVNGHSGPFHDDAESPALYEPARNEVKSPDYYSYDSPSYGPDGYDYNEHSYDNHGDGLYGRNDLESQEEYVDSENNYLDPNYFAEAPTTTQNEDPQPPVYRPKDIPDYMQQPVIEPPPEQAPAQQAYPLLNHMLLPESLLTQELQDPEYISHDQEYISQEPEYFPQETDNFPQEPEYFPQEPDFFPQESEYFPQEPDYFSQEPEYPPQEPEYPPQEPEYPPQEPKYPPRDPYLPPHFSSFSFSKLPALPALKSSSPPLTTPAPIVYTTKVPLKSQALKTDVSDLESFSFSDIKDVEPIPSGPIVPSPQYQQQQNLFQDSYSPVTIEESYLPSVLQDPYEYPDLDSIYPAEDSYGENEEDAETDLSLNSESSIFLGILLVGLLVLFLDYGYAYLTENTITRGEDLPKTDDGELSAGLEEIFQSIINSKVFDKYD